MKMKELLLVLSCVLGVSADALHGDLHIVGCSDFDGEDMRGLDREEIWYADFDRETGVYPLPPFITPISYGEGIYENAVNNYHVCRNNLRLSRDNMKDLPAQHDAPSGVMIYTRDEVKFGENNTLICHVTGFYPAPVRVSWTMNGEKVTEGTSINVPYPNKDGTFTQISRLQFIPQLGDIYSCTVEHLSLTQPRTKIYDVKKPEKPKPSVGPAVFCGLGVTIGMLSAAAGTFFLLKANKCI
ncbi:HLA class II histocompatibility antigen, DP alpha 1 chain-like [Archocentrus centrarchus]|uniref:HLA class II histocompatibility antigen, DP alpha 1 chain-like n=1 Tax=Archocentrus centrarchus TaxID=63155 RepID=UPI0011EA5267|nr:HLA class II histocompatibility antigen, DP alpha 1 chain-like [Archocentrus centrarchus]